MTQSREVPHKNKYYFICLSTGIIYPSTDTGYLEGEGTYYDTFCINGKWWDEDELTQEYCMVNRSWMISKADLDARAEASTMTSEEYYEEQYSLGMEYGKLDGTSVFFTFGTTSN